MRQALASWRSRSNPAGEVIAFAADLGEEGEVDRALSAIDTAFGGVRGLVDNAGALGRCVDNEVRLARSRGAVVVQGTEGRPGIDLIKSRSRTNPRRTRYT